MREYQHGRTEHGDCLELMKNLHPGSIDLILCDLPYGTTACSWDSVIPFQELWVQYNRVIKDNGVIVLTASQPFTSALVMSNTKGFKYEWIWEKEQGVNFLNAKKQPLKNHESVLVFSKGSPAYYPQMVTGCTQYTTGSGTVGEVYGGKTKRAIRTNTEGTRYPKTVQKFTRQTGLHPTQKPVALFEYLIRTYTREGDTVLDNCAGSFTTAIAAINTNRRFICMELSEDYYIRGTERISQHYENVLMKIAA